jgi:hypothetical protein
MKKFDIVALILYCSAGVLSASVNVDISGTVTKAGGGALQGVTVSLANIKGLSATTDADGKFTLKDIVNILHINAPRATPLEFAVKGNALAMSPASGKTAGTIDVFSENGRRTARIGFSDPKSGNVTLPELSPGVNFIRLAVGGELYACMMLRLGNELFLKKVIPQMSSTGNFMLVKQAGASIMDTLLARKTGYTDKAIPISSYTAQNIAIAMDSAIGCTVPPMPAFSALTANAKMPDPFKFMNGTRMTKKSEWTCRKAEISALAQQFIYGKKPPKPEKLEATYSGGSLNITCTNGGKSINFSVKISGVPSGDGPFPAFILMGGAATLAVPVGIAKIAYDHNKMASQTGSSRATPSGLFYTLYPDYKATGSLMAWAWGASRIIDALELCPDTKINPKRIATQGCSRDGKGSLVCGLFDDRIALPMSISSGSGGVSCWRVAETQGNVQKAGEIYGENTWMGDNFQPFGNAVNKLPIDQHEVVAIAAPRPVLIEEGTQDSWNCPVCCYHTAKYAQMVYGALGYGDYLGFGQVDHGHCAEGSNATQKQYFQAFCDRFLLDKTSTDTKVFSESFTFDKAKWQDGEIPTLEGELPPATLSKE